MANTKEAYTALAQGMADIDNIHVVSNHRKVFNEARLQELADNIKQVGVLEPILTRQAQGSDTEMILVAGARRLAAAKLAGLREVPYRMLNLDEAQANEVQALENLHRENLNPIEEAAAFKTLLDQGSYTPEDLAGRVNKHITYVYRAIKLLELPENAQEHIACGDFTPSHGHRLLQLPPAQQVKMIEWLENESNSGTSWPSSAALAQEIEYTCGRTLDNVCFPTDKEYAGAAACSSCAHNTAAQTMLFDAQGDGQCLNGECFAAKVAAFDQEIATAAAEKYPGMKYLGVLDWSWAYVNNTNLRRYGKKGIEVTPELAKRPEVKSALKKAPEKFGYCVSKGDHEVKLVLTDKELFEQIYPKREDGGQSQETPEQREARQKEAFFKEAEARALLKAAVQDKKPVTVAMLADMVFKQDCDDDATPFIAEALGLKEINQKTLVKLQPAVLLKLLWIGKALSWNYVREIMDENCFKPLGLKTAQIRAAARKAAGPAYEEYKAEQAELRAKEAAAKAGKKAKAKQEPEEETGEEGEGDDE